MSRMSETGLQDGTQGEIGVGHVVSHHNDAVPIHTRVLIQDPREEVKFLFRSTPGLFSLRVGQLHGGRPAASTAKVRLAALGQRLVRERN